MKQWYLLQYSRVSSLIHEILKFATERGNNFTMVGLDFYHRIYEGWISLFKLKMLTVIVNKKFPCEKYSVYSENLSVSIIWYNEFIFEPYKNTNGYLSPTNVESHNNFLLLPLTTVGIH